MPILIMLYILLLSSCVSPPSVTRGAPPIAKSIPKSRYAIAHDSAPKGPLPSTFKSAHPKSEPLSRYGNPALYAVEGKEYKVLRSASGYKSTGLASWYGTKFHSQRTSSGEDYDMYAMTAAHRTLPLPTYVKVTNLSNGRTAIVKVNDRGPFHEGRLIDLSYAAAAKLEILPHGTARVQVEALKLNAPQRAASYYIQAGAFQSKQSAEILHKKLSQWVTLPIAVENYQKHYIVKIGPLSSKGQSDVLKESLAHHGVLGSFSMLQ